MLRSRFLQPSKNDFLTNNRKLNDIHPNLINLTSPLRRRKKRRIERAEKEVAKKRMKIELAGMQP